MTFPDNSTIADVLPVESDKDLIHFLGSSMHKDNCYPCAQSELSVCQNDICPTYYAEVHLLSALTSPSEMKTLLTRSMGCVGLLKIYGKNLQDQHLWSEAIKVWRACYYISKSDYFLELWLHDLIRSGNFIKAQEILNCAEKRLTDDTILYFKSLLALDQGLCDKSLEFLYSISKVTREVRGCLAWTEFLLGHEQRAQEQLSLMDESAQYHVLALTISEKSILSQNIKRAITYLSQSNYNDSKWAIVELHMRLAQLAESVHLYPNAWLYYSSAHRLMTKLQPFDGESYNALNRWLDSKPWEELIPVEVQDGPSWIFIVGMPRSGTTLLEQILDMHPDCHGAGELNNISNLVHSLKDGVDPAAIESCIKKIYNHASELAPNTRFILDKMPFNFQYASLILHLFPKSKIIWCTRNSIDNTVSIWRQFFRGYHPYANDLHILGKYYCWHYSIMNRCLALNPDRVFRIQYESVVNEFDTTILSLLEWMDLPWNPVCKEFHLNARRVDTASRFQVNQPLYSTSLGRYQHYEPYLAPLIESLRNYSNKPLIDW